MDILLTVLTAIDPQGPYNFWQDAWSVTTDPAHIFAELVFTVIFDGLIVAVFYNLIFKKIILTKLRKEIHKDIDEAHGTTHEHNSEIS